MYVEYTHLRHAHLLRNLTQLDLDIDLGKVLGENIDLYQPRIHSPGEASKLRDQADLALLNWLVWVRADDAARNCTHTPDNGPERVNETSVESRACIGFGIKLTGVGGLEIATFEPCSSRPVSLEL